MVPANGLEMGATARIDSIPVQSAGISSKYQHAGYEAWDARRHEEGSRISYRLRGTQKSMVQIERKRVDGMETTVGPVELD